MTEEQFRTIALEYITKVESHVQQKEVSIRRHTTTIGQVLWVMTAVYTEVTEVVYFLKEKEWEIVFYNPNRIKGVGKTIEEAYEKLVQLI